MSCEYLGNKRSLFSFYSQTQNSSHMYELKTNVFLSLRLGRATAKVRRAAEKSLCVCFSFLNPFFLSSLKKEKMSQNLLQWTVADVASYFSAAGFPEQAMAFRTQVSAPPQSCQRGRCRQTENPMCPRAFSEQVYMKCVVSCMLQPVFVCVR